MPCKLRVLLADNQTLFREGFKRLIEDFDEPVEVTEAESLPAALALLEQDAGFDLLVLDRGVPGMNGLAGLPLLRRRAPDLPILLLHTVGHRQDAQEALAAGAAGYVPKTVSGQVLLDALKHVLAGGVYMPPLLREASFGSMTSLDGRRSGSELTPRQREVLLLLCDGLTNRQIAERMRLSEGTVKLHVAAVFKTLKVHSRTQAVMLATRLGLMATAEPQYAELTTL